MALENITGRIAWIFPDEDFDVDQIVGVKNIKITDIEELAAQARLCLSSGSDWQFVALQHVDDGRMHPVVELPGFVGPGVPRRQRHRVGQLVVMQDRAASGEPADHRQPLEALGDLGGEARLEVAQRHRGLTPAVPPQHGPTARDHLLEHPLIDRHLPRPRTGCRVGDQAGGGQGWKSHSRGSFFGGGRVRVGRTEVRESWQPRLGRVQRDKGFAVTPGEAGELAMRGTVNAGNCQCGKLALGELSR